MNIVKALFRPQGGVHPRGAKAATAAKSVAPLPMPKTLFVSLAQHLGAPSKPVVKKGDAVLKYQPIAEPAGYVSSWVHAPTSGTVKNIGGAVTSSARVATVIEIEPDGQDRQLEPAASPLDWKKATPKEIIDAVARAGIVGMGGAGFPTHVKLAPPAGKKIETIVVNGAECEPYLTADHRLMLEQPERIVSGAMIIRAATEAKRLVIAVEDNKPDAIQALAKTAAAADGSIEIMVLKTRYPQGAEKQLIRSATGREVPTGGLPMDVHALVENVATAAAIHDALTAGRPLVERIVTVTGDGIREPSNILAKVGAPFPDLIAFCGGVVGHPGKIICGGPMMGIAQAGPVAAMTKTTSGLLLLGQDKVHAYDAMPCIGCGRCVAACPSGLLPCIMSEYLEMENYDEAEKYGVLDCIECGCCAYECPAHRPLVQHMRQGKARVMARRRQRESLKKQEPKQA